jgi:hypothetical protein
MLMRVPVKRAATLRAEAEAPAKRAAAQRGKEVLAKLKPGILAVEEDEEVPTVNIKEEPKDSLVMTQIVPKVVVKTEPIDDDHHIPEFPLTTDLEPFELPQNVIIKEEPKFEEYALEDEVTVVEFPPEVNMDFDSQAMLESFSGQHELVIKEKVKQKIERKQMTERRRKTIKISIPQNAQVVDDHLTYHMETEPQSSNIRKILAKNKIAEVANARYTKFKCEHCTVHSRSRELVIRHIKEMHAFRCTVCLKIFPTQHKLAKHQESTHNMTQCEDGGRRKQKLQAKTEEVPAAFRMHTKS